MPQPFAVCYIWPHSRVPSIHDSVSVASIVRSLCKATADVGVDAILAVEREFRATGDGDTSEQFHEQQPVGHCQP